MVSAYQAYHSPSSAGMDTHHSKLGEKLAQRPARESLGEDIGALVFRVDMRRAQDAAFKMVLDVEPVDVDMFHPIMINRIMSNADRRFVVAADCNGTLVRDLQVSK